MRRGAIPLLAAGLVALVAAAVLGVAHGGDAAQAWQQDERQRRVETTFEQAISRLETLATDWVVLPDLAEDAGWATLQAEVASQDPDLDLRVHVHQFEPRTNRLRRLGTTDGRTRTRESPSGDDLPTTLRKRMERWFEDDAGTEAYCWFAAGPEGPRLHLLLGLYVDEAIDGGWGEDDDDPPPRVVHVSMRWPALAHVTVRLRADVEGTDVSPTLPTLAVLPASGDAADGAGGHDLSGQAVVPSEWSMSFPVGTDEPRIAWSAAGPGWPMLPLLLGGLGLLLALLGLWGARARRSAEPESPPDITAEAAHEMRTPLTAMRGQIEVTLRRERSAEDYRDALASCLRQAKGLQGILNNVLLLTQGTVQSPAQEEVDLAALVAGEIERVAGSHPERKVDLARPDTPVVLRGDPSLLARLVGNLLDNAALHSVAGGAIHAVVERDGNNVVLSVEDEGPGIPPSRQERIFERFYRGPDVGQRGVPGSGLGLPISRWIAGLHGGTLTIDPALRASTRFVLRLPAA